MVKHRTRRLLAVSMTGALFLAACGGDDSGDTASSTTEAGGASTASSAAEGSTAGSGGTTAGSLKGICPDTITIQTDWNPEAEHGGIYEMVGEGYTIDADKKIVSGPLVNAGEDTGIKIEVRAGGPAIGFQSPSSQMYQDKDITLGYVYTDEAIQNSSEMPTISVFAGLDKNPQIIMWDPATYPDVETIADLKEPGVKVRYFEGAAYMEYFAQTGILDKDQLDASYDGTPAVFVSQEGKIAQQGFASAEPYIYKNEVKDWSKDVAFQLVHDAGWQPYSGPLAMRTEDYDTLKDCMKLFVPIAQQAQVDYINEPAETNTLILELVEQYNTGWVYSEGVAEFSVQQMKDLGIVGNGTNDTIGDHDEDRVAELIEKAVPVYEATGAELKADLKPEDIVTNEFIDTSIKL